jgi:NAD(P)-dependent dehydrogenase (short-subunit alcohol dehydrogenase family)
MKNLKGRVAMITGASGGIGRATALAFADEGCDVVICARRKAELEQVADQIRAKGRQALAVPTDVGKEEEVEALANRAFAEFGKVDIAFSNAGIALNAQTHLLEKADWEKVMNVNFYGAVHVVRHFVRPMVERREGHFVVNSSGFGLTGAPYNTTYSSFGLTGAPYNTTYSTSKFALVGMTECLRAEVAQHNVGVTTLCGGVVETDIFKNAELKGFDDKARDALNMFKGMSPEKFAQIVVKAVKKNKGFVITDAMTKYSHMFKRYSPGLFELWIRQMPRFSKKYLQDV